MGCCGDRARYRGGILDGQEELLLWEGLGHPWTLGLLLGSA